MCHARSMHTGRQTVIKVKQVSLQTQRLNFIGTHIYQLYSLYFYVKIMQKTTKRVFPFV